VQIQVHITLDADDTLLYTPDAAAGQVIAALGGDPTKDWCTVYVATSTEPGTAGVNPNPQPPLP
jgi:hypothetical protein